ncbi:30S ribosomal protein S3, partial [Candidatus Woesearchaeota archaeon]|nr:30S ribosomal protein S3 [Candidatus Woesearchaeota archaeon]
KKFNLENPQIEISEIEKPDLDAQIVAERIASTLERFGSQKFKAVGHKVLQDALNAGALGIEVTMTGKLPSARAKRWRFAKGYMKKSGQIAITGVRKAYANAQLKTGTIGIQVRIMPPDLTLPDDVEVRKEPLDKPAAPEPKEKRKSGRRKTEEVKPDESQGTPSTE